jgi:hypothetical protein
MTGKPLRLRSSSDPLERGAHLAFDAMVSILAIGCLAGLWRVLASLQLKVPLDPNEGWNAYHAVSAMTGNGPYPAQASFLTNNYPPLSFYLVGLIGSSTGDMIVAGRVVSLASFLAVGGAIALVVKRFGCSWLESAFASLLFGAFLLLESDYVGMNDPQLLGQALQFGALILLLSRGTTAGKDFAGAVIFVTALFIKHNLVVLPAAATIWIAMQDWKRACRFAAFMLALGLGGLAAFRFIYGFDLLSRLNSPRRYSLELFAANFHDWLLPAALPFAATLAVGAARARYATFCAIYALLAVIVGGVFLGGAGVDSNAMFDADIAIALGSGLALNWAGVHWPARHSVAQLILAATMLFPLAAAVLLSFDPAWLDRDFWTLPLHDEATLAHDDIAYLRSRNGPVLCQMLSLCFWAGKAAAVDVFNLDQQFDVRARSEEPFVEMIRRRRYSVIQFDALSPAPFPTPIMGAILANYRVDRSNDDGVFLVPK